MVSGTNHLFIVTKSPDTTAFRLADYDFKKHIILSVTSFACRAEPGLRPIISNWFRKWKRIGCSPECLLHSEGRVGKFAAYRGLALPCDTSSCFIEGLLGAQPR